MKVEFKVRPVTRYVVTKFVEDGNTGSSSTCGEFDNHETAYNVGYALAKAELEHLGLSAYDETVMFPKFVPPSKIESTETI